MSADDARKDELAARTLSRLSEPSIPEGLADRIAARATAAPQIDAARLAEAPTGTLVALPRHAPTALRVAGTRRPSLDRRRHFIAASIAAALLASVGVYAGLRDRADQTPPLARGEPLKALPEADTPVPPRLADAARPAEALDAKPQHREKARPARPMITAPVPLPASPPVELVAEDTPSTPAAPKESPAEESKLAQTGPKNPPNISLHPVYGPPAPIGLGIAGGTGGSSLPGEASGGARGSGSSNVPPGGPPPGMPGPGGPRGPGPRL